MSLTLRSQHEVWGQIGRAKGLGCTDRQSLVKDFPLNAVNSLGSIGKIYL